MIPARPWVAVLIMAMVLTVGIATVPGAHGSARDTVLFPKTSLIELGTSTTCTYCPGADGAVNRLAEEMTLNELAIVEYHDGDSYAAVDGLSNIRFNFYDIPGTPMAFFSGENAALGGSTDPNDTAIYNWYKDKVNSDLQNRTEVVLGLDTGFYNNTVYANVTVISSGTPSDDRLYLHVVLVQDDNIMDGKYYIRYTAVKGIAETQITLNAGTVLVKRYKTTISTSWDPDKLYVVAFVQTHNVHNVNQGGYSWREGKIYNTVIRPVKEWDLVPDTSAVNTYANNTYVLNTTVRNDMAQESTVKVGYDPATVPAGWTVEICVGGNCYSESYVNLTLQPGEEKNVQYRITPGDSQITYIKIYAEGSVRATGYSDVHYIKVNSTGVPELNFFAIPLLVGAAGFVFLRRRKTLS